MNVNTGKRIPEEIINHILEYIDFHYTNEKNDKKYPHRITYNKNHRLYAMLHELYQNKWVFYSYDSLNVNNITYMTSNRNFLSNINIRIFVDTHNKSYDVNIELYHKISSCATPIYKSYLRLYDYHLPMIERKDMRIR